MKDTTKLKLVAIIIMSMSSALLTINIMGLFLASSITLLPVLAIIVNLIGYGIGVNLFVKTLRLESTLKMIEKLKPILEETIKNLNK